MNDKILIVGNGPSLTKIDYERLPSDIKVFRLNSFFFEDKYYVGKNVDYYLTDYTFLKNQFFNLYNLEDRQEYFIDNFYTCNSHGMAREYPSVVDILSFVYENKDFAKLMSYYTNYYQELVSGGMLATFIAANLGFRDIYMVGFDFYSAENYSWKHDDRPNMIKYMPRDCDSNVKNVINRYHPDFLQIKALELTKKQKGVNLYSICEDTKLNEYIELAPKLEKGYFVPELKKQENYIKDWLLLPDIDVDIKEEVSEVRNKLTLIQKIFSVKNEREHKVLSLFGIKLKFKRR